jgi:hypothetical protein
VIDPQGSLAEAARGTVVADGPAAGRVVAGRVVAGRVVAGPVVADVDVVVLGAVGDAAPSCGEEDEQPATIRAETSDRPNLARASYSQSTDRTQYVPVVRRR